MGKLELTDLQLSCIATLHDRGAHWLADTCRQEWGKGDPVAFDRHNGATAGIKRQLREANTQATRGTKA